MRSKQLIYISFLVILLVWTWHNSYAQEFVLPKGKKLIVAAEQSQHRVIIIDPGKGTISWEWKADSTQLPATHVKWFNNPSDAKIIYNGRFLLTSASGGGIALIRIYDKKILFHAYAGGNTHSIEVLPGGNIVSASSTGNYLRLFQVDTTIQQDTVPYIQYALPFAHNLVWDKKRSLLWSAGMHEMYAYKYVLENGKPRLQLAFHHPLPGEQGHDLFPVHGKDSLWFTDHHHIYIYDPGTGSLEQVKTRRQKGIKSVSSGPAGYPTIVIFPKEQWWTDEIFDLEGKRIFKQEGLKIYKARWVLPNTFSYQ